MKELSIIIPVYNVEHYIERCIRSLENQDIEKGDYEIICINDGSPDNCREIILKLTKEYDNIILIDQENQGVSIARNNGLDNASGKYVLFIDPDDYVLPNTFSSFLGKADKNKVQVSFLGFTVINKEEKVVHESFNSKLKSVYQGTEIYNLTRGDGRTDPDRMVAVLFQLDFIKNFNIKYLPKVPYLEDGELIARILCLAENCIFDGRPFYFRTTRPESATNSDLFFTENARNGFILAASNLRKFRDEEKLTHWQREFLNQPIAKFVLLAINSSSRNTGSLKLKDTIKELRRLNFRKLELKGFNRITFKINGFAYNISPYLSAVTLVFYPKLDILLIIIGKSINKPFLYIKSLLMKVV